MDTRDVLLQLRTKKGLSQEQLAEKVFVTRQAVSRWETGKCMPDYSIIQRLCEALHMTLPELMDGEDAAENSVHVTTMSRSSTCCAAHRSWSVRRTSSAALSSSSSASPAVPCPKQPVEWMYRTSFQAF